MARKLAAPVLIAIALAAIYYRVVVDLVGAWITDGNYSHGFLIVPLAAFFAWERRRAFQQAARRPSLWGPAIVAGSLVILLAGLLGSEFFLSRVSIIGVLGGLIVAWHGWRRLRVLAFPLAFLLLMIPLPSLLFNQVAMPLQFVASRAGEIVIDAFRIPVLREGNVLELANTRLEVAEACSGIRSLVSLITLGLVFGYFTDSRFWARAALVAATVPVAIVANGARVAGTGLLAYWVSPDAAQGFFHEFSGWIVFLVAFALILVVQRVLVRLAPAREKGSRVGQHALDSQPTLPMRRSIPVAVALSLIVGAGLVMRTNTRELAPARPTFGSFPMRIANWQGYPDVPFTPEVLAALGATDYLTRDYVSPERRAVGLYIGYWESQRQGETIHSPLNCLPGSGWEPISHTMVPLRTSPSDENPMLVNRYLVEKGLDRQVVFYWYQSHGRVTASEYLSKLYLMEDAVRLHRTDGAIVRVIAPIVGDGADAERRAEQLAARFIGDLVPQLPGFLPN